MGEVRSYRDLLVWQQAMDVAIASYDLSRAWPKDELYGLTAQPAARRFRFARTSLKAMGAKRAHPTFTFYTLRRARSKNSKRTS